MCESCDYDVLLTDWAMPGMTGVELIRETKALDRPRKPTAILMTGHAVEDQVHTLEALEVFALLSKPMETACLLDAVKRALDSHRRPNEPRFPPAP